MHNINKKIVEKRMCPKAKTCDMDQQIMNDLGENG